MVKPSMMTSTGTACSLISPPQLSMADMAIYEIKPFSGSSFARMAIVSGTLVRFIIRTAAGISMAKRRTLLQQKPQPLFYRRLRFVDFYSMFPVFL